MGITGWLKVSDVVTLIYLTFINFVIYLDRGAIAGVLALISKDLDLNAIEAGLLGSVFILGYMIASPIMAHSAQFLHPTWLIVIGLSVWVAAVIMCGLVNDYIWLAVFRSFTGVGEASFVSLAPPHLIKIAPPQYASLWLAIFYSTLFLGTAGGYMYSSSVASGLGPVGPGLPSWHWAFLFEGLGMLPVILFLVFLYKDPDMIVRKELSEGEGKTTFGSQLKQLLTNPVFLALSFGYGGYAFTIGGLSYWGPDLLHKLYGFSIEDAAFVLGALTIGTGFVATLLGSMTLDKVLAKRTAQHSAGEISTQQYEDNRALASCALLAIFVSIGTVFGVVGVGVENLIGFLIGVGLAEFWIFAGTGPAGMAMMTCVPQELRGQSNAVGIFIMHLVGDFPSPLVIGVFIHFWGDQTGMLICMIWLSSAAILWATAWNFAVKYRQRFPHKPLGFVLKHFCSSAKGKPDGYLAINEEVQDTSPI